MNRPERIIITGGPGAGKSSLLAKLSTMGYSCMPEASRAVIMEHQQQQISPWGDLATFVQLVSRRIYSQLQHPAGQLTFCDRGLPDGIAYLREAGIAISKEQRNFDPHLYYAREVFILPPWKEIYQKEIARQQEYEKAVSLYHFIRMTYLESGFRLIEVPLLPLEKRADFILNSLNKRRRDSLFIHSA